MLPLALILKELGWRVTGEDDAPHPAANRWFSAKEGQALQTHFGGSIPEGTELVFHSSAIRPDHPRLLEARQRGLECVRRGDLLARILKNRKLIAVCGSHGKTTTSALLVWMMRGAGWQGGHLVGGFFSDDQTPPGSAGRPSADSDAGNWFVAEIDESDGTIEALHPEITVCTAIDWDHSDHYPSSASFEAAFERLFRRTRGPVLVPAGCEAARRIASRLPAGTCLTFGSGGDFELLDWYSEKSGIRLQLGGRFGRTAAHVSAFGAFNAQNATAALAGAALSELPFSPDALASYPGMRRRQSVLFDRESVLIVEDYAHHPTEIQALMGWLREKARGGRLIVCFQPHRYSRTASFRQAFAQALAPADVLHLFEVYPAGEAPLEGGTSRDLLQSLREVGAGDRSSLPTDPRSLIDEIASSCRAGDVIAFVGAGDIDTWARKVVKLVELRFAPTFETPWPELRGRLHEDTVFRQQEPLATKTTLCVGGPAEFYAEPVGEADLMHILGAARARGLRILALGRGSNLLVADQGVPGLVLRLNQPAFCTLQTAGTDRLRAGAGLRLKALCAFAAKEGFAGFEFLDGIPGTVGGALRMNAGAMGGWMLDVTESVRVLDAGGELRTLHRDELAFGYRDCPTLKDTVVLEATLKAAGRDTPENLRQKMEDFARRRRATQPREASAGCLFKNPEGDAAGRLIDSLGLKGFSVGGAAVSEIHANFIINQDRASAADVIAVVREVRRRVESATGVRLQPEVQLCGLEWEEILK